MSRASSQPTSTWTPRRNRSLLFVALFVLVSAIGHVVGFAALDVWVRSQPLPPPPQRPVEMEIVQVEPPPPPPPEPEKPPEPPPPAPKPVVKPPPIKIAQPQKPPAEPPPQDVPPPSNDAPPPDADSKPPPLVVGISMSSTTSAGDFAAPVGNTAYGQTGSTATDPNSVKGYKAPEGTKYVPAHLVDREPTLAPGGEVFAEYPKEAQRAGIEGTVVVLIKVDETGKVVSAKVIRGPGYGLNEAAVEALRKFKFNPAIKNGQPVGTIINYPYTFVLP